MPHDATVQTSMADAQHRVLEVLACRNDRDGLYPSTIGYCAFPGARFRTPQGAAFASARLRHDMEAKGVIVWRSNPRGYFITAAGRRALEVEVSPPASPPASKEAGGATAAMKA